MTIRRTLPLILLAMLVLATACNQPEPTPEPTVTATSVAPPATAAPPPTDGNHAADRDAGHACPCRAALPQPDVAPAPAALLQGPGDRRLPKPWVRLHAAKDYVDMAAMLGAVSRRQGDLQPDAFAAAPASGSARRRQGPLPGLHRDPGGRADRRAEAVHREPLLRHQLQDHRPLPALSGDRQRPRQPGLVGQPDLAGLAGAVQPGLDRPRLAGCSSRWPSLVAKGRDYERRGQGHRAGRARAAGGRGDPTAQAPAGRGAHRGHHHAVLPPHPAAALRHRSGRAAAVPDIELPQRYSYPLDAIEQVRPRRGVLHRHLRPTTRGHVAGRGIGARRRSST